MRIEAASGRHLPLVPDGVPAQDHAVVLPQQGALHAVAQAVDLPAAQVGVGVADADVHRVALPAHLDGPRVPVVVGDAQQVEAQLVEVPGHVVADGDAADDAALVDLVVGHDGLGDQHAAVGLDGQHDVDAVDDPASVGGGQHRRQQHQQGHEAADRGHVIPLRQVRGVPEIDGGHGPLLVVQLEELALLDAGGGADQAGGEALAQGVEIAHHGVVVAARVLQVVLDGHQAAVQLQEVGVGLERRVGLDQDEDAAQGRGQAGLLLAALGQRGRVRGRGHGGGAGGHDGGQGLVLVAGVAAHRLDQGGDQVPAALELDVDVAEGVGQALAQGDEAVEGDDGVGQGGQEGQQGPGG